MQIRYTYGEVVATLAMIETPTTTAIVRTSVDKDDSDPALKDPLDQELLLVKVKPITSKLRTAVRHLKQRAGRMARFRGLHIFIIYNLVSAILESFATSLLSRTLVARSVSHVCVTVILCRLSMVWTHHVISEPSSKPWYRRVTNYEDTKRIVVPTAVFALAEQATVFIPAFVFGLLGLTRINHTQPSELGMSHLAKGFSVAVVGLISFLVIYFPAQVMLVRVQGSLLAEEEESIVPFDRTYGGKVIPAIVGGSGKLGMRDAWKTFDWNSRVRLFKIYAKVLALQIALFFLFVGIVGLELRLALGKQLDDLIVTATRH